MLPGPFCIPVDMSPKTFRNLAFFHDFAFSAPILRHHWLQKTPKSPCFSDVADPFAQICETTGNKATPKSPCFSDVAGPFAQIWGTIGNTKTPKPPCFSDVAGPFAQLEFH